MKILSRILCAVGVITLIASLTTGCKSKSKATETTLEVKAASDKITVSKDGKTISFAPDALPNTAETTDKKMYMNDLFTVTFKEDATKGIIGVGTKSMTSAAKIEIKKAITDKTDGTPYAMWTASTPTSEIVTNFKTTGFATFTKDSDHIDVICKATVKADASELAKKDSTKAIDKGSKVTCRDEITKGLKTAATYKAWFDTENTSKTLEISAWALVTGAATLKDINAIADISDGVVSKTDFEKLGKKYSNIFLPIKITIVAKK